MSVCHICSAHPCLRVPLYMSGLILVSPSQKIKLYIDDPTHIATRKSCLTNSQTNIGSPLVRMVFSFGHSSKATMNSCNNLRNQTPSSRVKLQTQGMIASTMALAVAQAIATNPQASVPIQTSHNPIQSAKATDPKPFDGNWVQTEEFIRAIQSMVTMQAGTFGDKRMKILYALSFMHGGMAKVWAANETMAVITGTSQMQTLDIFLRTSKRLLETQIGHGWLVHSFMSIK